MTWKVFNYDTLYILVTKIENVCGAWYRNRFLSILLLLKLLLAKLSSVHVSLLFPIELHSVFKNKQYSLICSKNATAYDLLWYPLS